jgi:hypothetical protein
MDEVIRSPLTGIMDIFLKEDPFIAQVYLAQSGLKFLNYFEGVGNPRLRIRFIIDEGEKAGSECILDCAQEKDDPLFASLLKVIMDIDISSGVPEPIKVVRMGEKLTSANHLWLVKIKPEILASAGYELKVAQFIGAKYA